MSSSTTLTVKADPRISFPLDELRKQFALHIEIRNTLSEVSETVVGIRSIYDHLDRLNFNVVSNKEAASIKPALNTFREKLRGVEHALTEPRMEGASDAFHFPVRLDNQLVILLGTVANSDRAPTSQAYEVFEILKSESEKQIALFRKQLKSQLPALNKKLTMVGLEPIITNKL